MEGKDNWHEMIYFSVAAIMLFGLIEWLSDGAVSGVSKAVTVGLAFWIAVLRAHYLPYHFAFVWPHLHPSWYLYHPVAWDDLCNIFFPRLDQLLAAYVELEPKLGQKELARLIENYPAQRLSALRAQARLIARAARQEERLYCLDEVVAGLSEGEDGFLSYVPQRAPRITGFKPGQTVNAGTIRR